jgi:hypothetical protein
VNATDDGGMKHVYAVYWIDDGAPQYALLILENGVYQGSIILPEGSNLHYYFVADDMSGNTNQGTQTNVGVTPNEVETPAAELPWLYIIIIIILAVIIVVLLVTRNKGGAAPAAAAPAEPAPEEIPEEKAPENVPAAEESEVIEP